MSARMVTLSEFLTDEQMKRCLELYPDRKRIRDEVIAPNMETINKKLGQENDADYLAYAVVFVIGQVAKNNNKN